MDRVFMSEPKEVYLDEVYGFGSTPKEATNDLAQRVRESKREINDKGIEGERFVITRTEYHDPELDPDGSWSRKADIYGVTMLVQSQAAAGPITKITSAAHLNPPSDKRQRG
jgi:hypothetical protein